MRQKCEIFNTLADPYFKSGFWFLQLISTDNASNILAVVTSLYQFIEVKTSWTRQLESTFVDALEILLEKMKLMSFAGIRFDDITQQLTGEAMKRKFGTPTHDTNGGGCLVVEGLEVTKVVVVDEIVVVG